MASEMAADLLGMTKKAAQDRAEAKNFVFRLIRIDEEQYFSYPEDRDEQRVCVEIDNGKVTKVTVQ